MVDDGKRLLLRLKCRKQKNRNDPNADRGAIEVSNYLDCQSELKYLGFKNENYFRITEE